MESISLSSKDWDVLLPGESLKIGTQTIMIKPLGLESFAQLLREFKLIADRCTNAGITLDNYQSELISLAEIIIEDVPNVLTVLTGINSDDVQRLPPAVIVKLLTICFKINIDSQDDLAKNLVTLTDQIGQITEVIGSPIVTEMEGTEDLGLSPWKLRNFKKEVS